MTLRQILGIVRIASVAIVLAAIVTQAIVLANAGAFDPTRFFAFFTILSNLIGVAAFLWLLARGDRPRSRSLDLVRGAAVVYLTVTFFVVIFLLSGVDVQLQLVWVDVVLHKVFPIIVVLDWILDPPRCVCGSGTVSCGSPSRSRGQVSLWSAERSMAGIPTLSWTRPTADTARWPGWSLRSPSASR